MRACPSCGLENSDDVHFCSCGEYLRWEPTTRIAAVKAPSTTAGAPDEPSLDPEMTLAGDLERVWATPAAPGGLPAGVRPEPGAPGRGDAPPGEVSLTLRLPGDAASPRAPLHLSVEPGGHVTIVGVVRNQSQVVDNFDLWIRGLPEDWWTITPATAYLVPYGSDGAYEQEVQIHVAPPRSPEAQARAWPFAVVAESRAYGGEVGSAGATVTIGPFYEVATELRPERAAGRLRARFRLVVRNRANARTEVRLHAEDSEGKCRFRFAQPSVVLDPGTALECPFTVLPPKQHWFGRSIDRRFTVSAAPVELDKPPAPRPATFRQRPWFPRWLLILAVLLILLAILLVKLLPHSTQVPNVVGLRSTFAAQQLLNKDGFSVAPNSVSVPDKGGHPLGSVASQSPPAGTGAKQGTSVTLAVYAGSGKVKVPSVVGLTVGLADESLRASGLALGAATPQPANPNRKIASQLPLAGATVSKGTAIAVFLVTANPRPKAPVRSPAKPVKTTSAGSASPTAPAPKPAPLIKIPAVAGDPTSAASRISQAGLEPKPIEKVAVAPAGKVAGTIPAAGTKVAKGSIVAVLISIGSPRLSYDNHRVIAVVNPVVRKRSGGVPQRAGTNATGATWSPDGTHLIYSLGGQLAIDQPNNRAAPLQLTSLPKGQADTHPAFAPTARSLRIAFIHSSAGSKLCFATIKSSTPASSCANAPPGWTLDGAVQWVDGSHILVPASRDGGRNFGIIEFESASPFSTTGSDWGHARPVSESSVPGRGVLAAAVSPKGNKVALVAGSKQTGFGLYLVPDGELRAGQLTYTADQALGVRACQIAWRPDGLQLAVMQPSRSCTPTALGTIISVDPADPQHTRFIAGGSANPAWQPAQQG